MPKISVCISTYNRKDYLSQTIASVLKQNYKDYEVIIVDDGSTDGTEEMIKEGQYPVRYYKQENAGDAAAKNRMIQLAEGEYITFIDSDDLFFEDSLERMIDALKGCEENTIAYGGYIRIDENGVPCGRCKRTLRSGKITEKLFETIMVHNCGTLYPKDVLASSGGYDTSLKGCYDLRLNLRLSQKFEFIALKEPVFQRRRHSSNLSVMSVGSCLTELKVLSGFYFDDGGKDSISRQTAMKRISQAESRVGKAAFAESNFAMAGEFFIKSFRTKANIKSLLRYGVSKVYNCFAVKK